MPPSPDQAEKFPYSTIVFDRNAERCRVVDLSCTLHRDRVRFEHTGTPLLKFASENNGVEVAFGDLPTEATFHLGPGTAISIFADFAEGGVPIVLISGDRVDEYT